MQLYGAVWKPKQVGVIFPDFLDTLLVYANLELFWMEVSTNDLNEDHKEPCKMKSENSARNDLAYFSQEIGQAVVNL